MIPPRIVSMICFSTRRTSYLLAAASLAISVTCAAQLSTAPVDEQVNTPEIRERVTFAFDDPERYRFRWTPGGREGVRLDELDDNQRHALRDLLRTVLSEVGANKVDAIIATEALDDSVILWI